LDLRPTAAPWRLDKQPYLTNHVFYRQLKSKPVDVDRFTTALADLPGSALDEILAEVPPEWNNKVLREVELHLRAVSEHATEFAEEVRRRLA